LDGPPRRLERCAGGGKNFRCYDYTSVISNYYESVIPIGIVTDLFEEL